MTMTITLSPEVQAVLERESRQRGITPESLVVAALCEKFALSPTALRAEDDWEKLILGVGTDCGVSLSHEALSNVCTSFNSHAS